MVLAGSFCHSKAPPVLPSRRQSPQPPQPPQPLQPPKSTSNQLPALSVLDGHSVFLIPAPAMTTPTHPNA